MKRLKVYLLVSVLMALPALIIGCSKSGKAKNPLKSMTIEEVRRMVEDWNWGQLPEQQAAKVLQESDQEVSLHSPALFLKVFGDPDNKQLVERNYYFYYKCKDGMVQMILPLSGFEQNMVTIRSVNVY